MRPFHMYDQVNCENWSHVDQFQFSRTIGLDLRCMANASLNFCVKSVYETLVKRMLLRWKKTQRVWYFLQVKYHESIRLNYGCMDYCKMLVLNIVSLLWQIVEVDSLKCFCFRRFIKWLDSFFKVCLNLTWLV